MTARLAVYPGNTPADVQRFENWLGRPVNAVLGYISLKSWSDFVGTALHNPHALWAGLGRPVYWSLPLIVNGANLKDAANGLYDAYWKQAAASLMHFQPDEPHANVRIAWECNGLWMPWYPAVAGQEALFIKAFRRLVVILRQAAVDVGRPASTPVIEWNVACGEQDPTPFYPGDDVVDVIGMDVYWDVQYSHNPLAAWAWMVSQPFGMQWHQDFAAKHKKPTSYSEWGVNCNEAGPYIQCMKEWVDSHRVLFHTYWDSNSNFAGQLSQEQYPASGVVYKACFG